MARYIDGRCRLCRRAGEKLFLKGDKCLTPHCPVQSRGPKRPKWGGRGGRGKVSQRGLQLQEKQKAKQIYGVLERQFRRFLGKAEKLPGATGENLIQLLERRLDNVVFRLGFASSRPQARQLVQHGHLTVNNRRLDIPSAILKPGDTVAWRELSQKTAFFQNLKQHPPQPPIPPWISLDADKMAGRVLALPKREEVEVKLSENTIVEYYAR